MNDQRATSIAGYERIMRDAAREIARLRGQGPPMTRQQKDDLLNMTPLGASVVRDRMAQARETEQR